MTAYAIVTTSADPARVGLAYKVEFEGDEALEEWYGERGLKQQRHQVFAQGKPLQGSNTGITIIWNDGRVESHAYEMTMQYLARLLQRADYELGSASDGRPGRPEKKVLVLTTSKDRRMGKLVAKQASY